MRCFVTDSSCAVSAPDPRRAEYEDVLKRLAPFPVGEYGYKIAASTYPIHTGPCCHLVALSLLLMSLSTFWGEENKVEENRKEKSTLISCLFASNDRAAAY